MAFATGREYLAIPGPSAIPERVLAAMHRPAPNIYEGELIALTASLATDLKALAGTTGDVAMYIANGHGAWEAAAANVFSAGDVALVLSTGIFAPGWGSMAARMGVTVETLDFGKRAAIDPGRVAEVLAADTAHRIRAVVCVQTDTSTSVRNDIAAVRAAIDAAGHPALFLVDCICSLGCEPFHMDAWGVDVMVSACQKGLMTPPGLGFVWYNRKAAEARRGCLSNYWDWAPRAHPEIYSNYWNGTAPTHHVYGLRAALDMIAEEGREAVWARHARVARAYWAAVEAWGAPLELNVPDPASRSHAVTALRIGAPHATALRDWVSQNAGVTLGIGLGMAVPGDPAWHGFFRIGHMGHVNAHMALGVAGAIEAGLTALGIPHRPGGLEAAAKVFAG
jgi:alanine-glyoxylate transaminase/serine-glyoxylate transaminase/serine-pyruvate transaminase